LLLIRLQDLSEANDILNNFKEVIGYDIGGGNSNLGLNFMF
jgi:hypothetical protein